jgi:microcystin-dependent protein
MESKDIKQVLAMKYIIRRFVALFLLAAVVAVPAVLGALSFVRDKDDNHNKVGSESNALSYAQIEPHIRTYMNEANSRIATDGESTTDGESATDGESSTESATDAESATGNNAATDANTGVNTNVAVGTVLMYAGDKMPKGFLRCDGKEISRKKYKALYAVIGDKYGTGDGKKTFNLPNMRTLLPVNGNGDVEIGEGGAEATGTAAAFAFKKISEPTGPPPVVDLDKERKKEAAEEGGSAAKDGSNDANGIPANTAVMYFIIKCVYSGVTQIRPSLRAKRGNPERNGLLQSLRSFAMTLF